MKKLIFLFSTLSLTLNFCFAQYQLSGQVVDTNKEPLGFANIVLSLASDSSFVDGTTSDMEGQFSLNISNTNAYFVTISTLGFNAYHSNQLNPTEQNPKIDLGTITLSEGGLQLKEVQVVATKPIFERKIDRTVINLENRTATAGATALEVLEQSPGVVVDRSSGGIGMLGKDGVNVMINGKLNYMPNDALIQFLGGMDANNITKIELITTPPANLDAQGNAGFINIVLKRNTDEGLKGSYALTSGYGRGLLGNASINLNYRKGKINFFGNYAYTHNEQEQFTTLSRTISDFQTDLNFDREPTRNNQNTRLGLDYRIGKNTTIGILFSGYLNKWDMDALNTIVQKDTLEMTIISENREDNDWQHAQGNINLVHQFQNGGRISTDFDYLYYRNENPTTYDQTFQDENGTTFKNADLLSSKITPFDIQVGKIDYSLPIDDDVKIALGTKYVQSNFENDVLAKENNIELTDFISESDLTENIFAAYTELDYQLSEKVRLKGGLRYEYTDTELNSTNGGKVVDRQFGALFPSLYFNYKINPTNLFNLSYSKRINRPSFSSMAPFINFLSPSTTFGGNAALQPAIANTIQADYRYKTINFSILYTHEDSTIALFQNRFDPQTNTQIIIPVNLKEQETLSASIAFPIKVNDWWNMRLFGIVTRQKLVSIDDEFGIQELDQNFFRINGSQSFRLPRNFNIELSGFYQSDRLRGNVKFKPQNIFNIGIQKKLKHNARLTFNINDVFNSLEFTGVTDLPNENIFVTRTFDFSQRTFRLTYSASFGNQKVKNNRKRNSGGEEKRRVN